MLYNSEINNVLFFSRMLLGFGFSIVISYLSYRVKFLTLGGSVATFILAGVIFSLGGLQWSVPILTFFILSSILSKLRKKNNKKVELFFEKGGVRDQFQVLANGGIGGVLVILNSIIPNDLFYMIYLSSLAAVCADTWATEIGTYKKTATYNILNLKPIEQGVSGGVSMVGSLAALLGASTIALSGISWNKISILYYFLLIVFAGVFGSFFDSYLGATIQAQNKCKICNKVTERDIHCGNKAEYYSGLKWINNDLVNFLSSIAGALVLLFLINIIR